MPKEPIIVRIQPMDISRGEQRCSTSCPVARAFKRAYPEADLDGIAPDMLIVNWPHEESQQRYNLTTAAREWIKAFDEGRDVQPGDLHLFNL